MRSFSLCGVGSGGGGGLVPRLRDGAADEIRSSRCSFFLDEGSSFEVSVDARMVLGRFSVYSRAHPAATTFPPCLDIPPGMHRDTGPSTSPNTFSVSTITDGYAGAGEPQLFLPLRRQRRTTSQ